MLIEFKITRRNDEIVGIKSTDDNLVDIPPDLPPHTTDRIAVSIHFMPPDVSRHYYTTLVRQMKTT